MILFSHTLQDAGMYDIVKHKVQPGLSSSDKDKECLFSTITQQAEIETTHLLLDYELSFQLRHFLKIASLANFFIHNRPFTKFGCRIAT